MKDRNEVEHIKRSIFPVYFSLLSNPQVHAADGKCLNIGLCGHFLIMLTTTCFAAFYVVPVQYKKCRMYKL